MTSCILTWLAAMTTPHIRTFQKAARHRIKTTDFHNTVTEIPSIEHLNKARQNGALMGVDGDALVLAHVSINAWHTISATSTKA